MFIATVINAVAQSPRSITMSDASYVHAAVLSAITRVNTFGGRSLHDSPRHKVFSCAIIPDLKPVVRIRTVFHSDIGLEYCQSLLTALCQIPILRLGNAIYEIRSVEMAPSTWSGLATWVDLLDGSQANQITLRFMTPTAIMKTDGAGRRFSALLPHPVDIFLGLQRRWDALGGPALPGDFADVVKEAGCIITRYQLETSAFHTPERQQIGFHGSVTYQLRHTNPAFVRAMCALARFAHYTGVGYQTTRGMGLVQSKIG